MATHPDITALRIMLGKGDARERQAQLTALAKRHADELAGRVGCPGCGDQGPHADNGATRRDERSYLCAACGDVFDAE